MNSHLTPDDMDRQDLCRIIELDAVFATRVKESLNSIAAYVEIHGDDDTAYRLRSRATEAQVLAQRLRSEIARLRHPHHTASRRAPASRGRKVLRHLNVETDSPDSG